MLGRRIKQEVVPPLLTLDEQFDAAGRYGRYQTRHMVVECPIRHRIRARRPSCTDLARKSSGRQTACISILISPNTGVGMWGG